MLCTMQGNHYCLTVSGIKKQWGLFDVTMCAYDGTEVFALVGSYMLNILSKKYKKQF